MLIPARMILDMGRWALPLVARVPLSLQRVPLEQLFNQVLAVPLRDGDFDILEGRWLCLDVRDLKLKWYLSVLSGELRLAAHAPADGCISGNWSDFLLLASRQEDPDTLFFRRRLVIEGDTELCLGVKNLIDSLDTEQLPSILWRPLQWLGREAAGRQKGIPIQSGV